MKVLKFGGTSVANEQNIKKAIAVIQNIPGKKVVVVSALAGVTDSLSEAINQAKNRDLRYKNILTELQKRHYEVVQKLLPDQDNSELQSYIKSGFVTIASLLDGCFLLGELSAKTNDTILSYGELFSSRILFAKLQSNTGKVAYCDSRELIKTNEQFGNAAVDFETSNYAIQYYFDKNQANSTILPGFIAESHNGHTTTLGRGGSDYTAAVIAASLDAVELQIWTDVNGMYTANPKLVKQARAIAGISYKEAMELSHFGAKVLYAPTLQPVLNKNIPVYIKNTFDPDAPGTHIASDSTSSNEPVKGISHIENIALLTLEGSGLIGVAGVSEKLFGAVAREGINIVFITQASSEHSICIGIQEEQAQRAKKAIDMLFQYEIRLQKIKPVYLEKNLSIIALVGENMKNHQGLSGKMFSTLGRNNVNVRAIAQGASERNISAVIDKKDVVKALNVLHECFFEDDIKQLHLFICGVGNVGGKLLEQLHQQADYLRDNLKLNLRVVGISNSRKLHFDVDGIALDNWKAALESGEDSNPEHFINRIEALNLPNSIFIDNTASEKIASLYKRFLAQNVAVVTCNKIACSSEYSEYEQLKKLSKKYNAPFLFETNVGAGLPIIDTLKNLIASGDKVHQIQAVLSGSLNFIFNNFKSGKSFHDIVLQAQQEGYTEPNPKLDLSGIDVMRKILILIRESGYPMEIDAIANDSFLPDPVLQAESTAAFFESLQQHASHFEALYNKAEQQSCRLKYVARFENGKASVGLQYINKEHPFYHLEGKDNIVLFYTDRYAEQPLQIKGAGAGAAVTASGVFADVIRIGNL
ncbi:bifunctional aspartate kinase/homoserine dehydrogenase I [Flavobacterium supellecticarium]|uniref:Bifunctional aspartate kinase/homoserine dehydrogenase I n=1 Tax=Flavobacterium supellecticarium TaxID=2565924 RepID=A0A4S4A4I0_9FLAO|nr:bifunctional aspartate kinase/homoserine dehydrogenase I [Flavobacterium supellecticarium]THF53208.1 bifunctional aspartate kinase/homoserine dehydrogenase I [Flavobacterium supellecticarium]